MPNLARVRTTWSGSPVVGGGVSTFYFDEASSGFVADVAAFWVALAARFPTGITFQTLNTGDLIDVATGAISGSWTDGSTSNAVTSGTPPYAAGVGASVVWQTSGVRNGRRVKGRTFLCPLVTSAFDNDGTIAATPYAAIVSAAGTLVTATFGEMYIYSRPRAGMTGARSVVQSSSVADKVSWLRSRRV